MSSKFDSYLKAKRLKEIIKNNDVQAFEKFVDSGFDFNYTFFRWMEDDEDLIHYISRKASPEILKIFLQSYKKPVDALNIKVLFCRCDALSRYDLVELILLNKSFWEYPLDAGCFISILRSDNIKLLKLAVENGWLDINSCSYNWLNSDVKSLQMFRPKRYNLLSYAISYNALKSVKYLLKHPNISVNDYNMPILSDFEMMKNQQEIRYYRGYSMTTFNNIVLAKIVGNKKIEKLVLNHEIADINQAQLWMKNNFKIFNPQSSEYDRIRKSISIGNKVKKALKEENQRVEKT